MSASKLRGRLIDATLVAMMCSGIVIGAYGLGLSQSDVVPSFAVKSAHADEARSSTELKLAAGQKLVDVSWRCFGDYPCRPFVLTRAMRKDEAPESYALSSPYSDASDAYVIKESR